MAAPILSKLQRSCESAWAPGVLFLAALALRAIYTAAIATNFTPGVEIWEYGWQGVCAARNARDLCLWDQTGQPYVSALMPPLTSYLWLGLLTVFGITAEAHVAYVVLNIIVGAACAPLLYAFAREVGLGRGPAAIAGGILAAYPTFIAVSAGYHATNFTIALMLIFAFLFLRTTRELDWRMALAAGLAGGFAAMTRNELLVIAAAATMLLVWLGRKRLVMAMRAAAALTLGVGLVTAPWIARNYAAFESFIPIGSQGGYNIWIGFGPYARGSGNELDNDPAARAAARSVRHSVAPGDSPGDRFEPRLQRAFLEDAQPAMRERSIGDLVSLTAQKFTLLWVFDWTDPLTHTADYWGPWITVHLLALYALFALWRGRAPPIERNAAAFIILSLALFTLTYSATSVFARYRMHMEPFIFLFAAIGAWALLSRWARN